MADIAQIRFGEGLPTLLDYDKSFWPIEMTKTVEFFPNKIFTVKMVSSNDPNLEKYLNELDEDCKTSLNEPNLLKYEEKIAIDLEWEVEINLFQFCSPKGRVLLIRHPDGPGNDALFKFLITHKFYGKGTDSDVKQLHRKFSYLIKNDDSKSKQNQKKNSKSTPKKKKKKNKKNVDNDESSNNENTSNESDINDDNNNTNENENSNNEITKLNDDENNDNENDNNIKNDEIENCNDTNNSTKVSISFSNLIEDIAKTRLAPYGYSENFVKMTKEFAGNPCAEFKDSEMTMSNWAAEELTVRQVLYGAFDVVAIYMCYPNFKPPKNIQSKESKNSLKKKFKKNKEPKKVVNKAKIIVLRNPIQKIYPVIIYGYSGPINPIDLRFILQNADYVNGIDGSEDDLDFASPFTFNNILYILAAFKKNISEEEIMNRLRGYADSVKFLSSLNNDTINYDIDSIDPSDCTDRDFLYVTNVPNSLFDQCHFSRFLYNFGTNFDFKIYDSNETIDDFSEFYPLKANKGYIQIEPRDASSSYRMKLFIPFLFNMKIYTFPTFLPIIRVDNIPNEYSTEDLKKIYPNSTKIDFLRFPNKKSTKTSFIEFKTVSEAEESIQKTNYLQCSSPTMPNKELHVARYTTEAHLKFLKLFELSVHHCKKHGLDSSSSLRSYFQKYGKIYQAYYDESFEIGHVQFYVRKDALKAIDEEMKKSKNSVEIQAKTEKNENDNDDNDNDSKLDFIQPLFCETVPEDRIFVIRDVSFNVDDSEIYDLCSPYGDIQDIQTRDLTSYMRYSIKEITYSTHESAYQARLSLFSHTIKGNTVRVAVLNGGNVESTSWKNNQKKQWIIFRDIINYVDKKEKNEEKIKDENKGIENEIKNIDDKNIIINNSNNESANMNDNENKENENINYNNNYNENENINNNNNYNENENINNNKYNENENTNNNEDTNNDNKKVNNNLNNNNDNDKISLDYRLISIDRLYNECLKYGDIVRYEIHIGNHRDVCVMYSNFESADSIRLFITTDRILSQFTIDTPNNEEFVSILNPTELGLVFITSKEKEKIKSEMEQLKKVIGDEEESTLVILFKSLHARQDTIDIYDVFDGNPKVTLPKKPNDPLDSISVLTREKIDEFLLEFQGMYDVYLNEEEDRAIIFAQSKAIVKKIFKNFWQEGRFNPIRIKFKDIENPPSINLSSSSFVNNNNNNNNNDKIVSESLNLILKDEINNGDDDDDDDSGLITIEGFSGSEKIIVVDPIPEEMNEDVIMKICAESQGKFEIRITKSAKVKGLRRALLFGKNHATRNKLLREMSGAFKGHPIKSVAMYIHEIPPSLM